MPLVSSMLNHVRSSSSSSRSGNTGCSPHLQGCCPQHKNPPKACGKMCLIVFGILLLVVGIVGGIVLMASGPRVGTSFNGLTDSVMEQVRASCMPAIADSPSIRLRIVSPKLQHASSIAAPMPSQAHVRCMQAERLINLHCSEHLLGTMFTSPPLLCMCICPVIAQHNVKIDLTIKDVKHVTESVTKAQEGTGYAVDLGSLASASQQLEAAQEMIKGFEGHIRDYLGLVERSVYTFGAVALGMAAFGALTLLLRVRLGLTACGGRLWLATLQNLVTGPAVQCSAGFNGPCFTCACRRRSYVLQLAAWYFSN